MLEKYGKKTKRHKKIFKTGIIATMLQCSERLVRKVRAKEIAGKPIETPLEQRIQVADMLLDERANLLIDEVKRIINF